jgi:opacity protein-like surface antigen
MKKVILPTLLLISNISYAKTHYVGLEYQANNLSYESPSNSVTTINPDDYYESDISDLGYIVGYQIDDKKSIEFNYSQLEESKTNNNTGLVYGSGALVGQDVVTTSNIELKSYSIDFLPSYNIQDTYFSIDGIIGVSYLDFKLDESFNDGTNKTDSEKGFGVNLGFGASYNLNDKYVMFARFKYSQLQDIKPTNLDGINEIENISKLSAGFLYKF